MDLVPGDGTPTANMNREKVVFRLEERVEERRSKLANFNFRSSSSRVKYLLFDRFLEKILQLATLSEVWDQKIN